MTQNHARHGLPEVLFVTDPLCSWCWGTLPELLEVKRALQNQVHFNLIMGGLQIGPRDGLLGYDKKRLRKLWAEVAETTGQIFSGVIPTGFVYHSELACRAVEIARRQNNDEPPFEFFHRLQSAFYLDGKDLNDPEVLANLLGISVSDIVTQLTSDDVIQSTQANFDRAKALSANALPGFMINTGSGFKLLCGGYVTKDYLLPDILNRIG